MTVACFGRAGAARREARRGSRTLCGWRRLIAICWLLPVCGTISGQAAADSLDEAAERYRPLMIKEIGMALSGVRDLRESISRSDLRAARQAWISARAGWERSEVFTAGFVPELDRQIDAWPDATAGFHAIEAKLFGANRTDVVLETDELIAHLANLQARLHDMPLTPQGLLDGTARLAYEVGESKSDGGESRISGTSLDDMRNNVEGIDVAYRTIFAQALEAADRKLAETIAARIDRLRKLVASNELKQVNVADLRRASEELAVGFQNAAPRIGLVRPTLEASP
jgi:iron uptake system component EfeO